MEYSSTFVSRNFSYLNMCRNYEPYERSAPDEKQTSASEGLTGWSCC